MEEFIVVAILLALCMVLIAFAVLIWRLLGVWKSAGNSGALTTAFKAQSDEKSALTKADQHPTYMDAQTQRTVNRGASSGVNGLETAATAAFSSKDSVSIETESHAERSSTTSGGSISIASDGEPGAGLQRAISCESIDSVSSVMDLVPDEPRMGQLEFGIEYDYEVSELVVSVIQARDLDLDEASGSLDTFVKVWIFPSRQHKVQTKIARDSVNPAYKERFLFSMEPDELAQKVVHFQVLACDKYARQRDMGEADLKLGDVDLRQPLRVWVNLRDSDQKPTELGDLMFSLSYLPTAERLTVVIVKCRSLKWADKEETGDCFLKVYLLQNGKKISKKKTSIKRDCTTPIFNEAMMFSVPGNALPSLQLRLSVAEVLADGTHSSIGHVIVGSQLSGTELTHWNQMMTSLRKPVSMWHCLRK